MKKLNKKGFTLIELIVVIAILAILAAILIPSVTGYIAKANASRDKANCRSMYSELSLEVMLDQTLSYTSGQAYNGITLTFSADTTNNVVSSFSCSSANGSWSAPNFSDPTP